jgi:predicted ATP-grasp superfamily ATP-dependent carboligase
MKNKAVILGSNYYIGLSVIRCLGIHNINVVSVDYSGKSAYGSYSKYCSERLICPHYRKYPEKFIEYLINYSKEQCCKPVLFPCADPYVELIDKYLLQLKNYYLIPQLEQGLYTRVMCKDSLFKLATEHNILLPETVLTSEENYLEKIEKTIKYPCLVKPVDSHYFVSIFRQKLFKVYNKFELEAIIANAKKAGTEVIIQRIIPGSDDHMYTFDAYLNQEGKLTNWVTCQKLRQYPINYGASVYTCQKYVPDLLSIGGKFLEAIKWRGFAEIEFKKASDNGKFYLIEVNVRTTNLNNLLYKCGINFPYICYKELAEGVVNPCSVTIDTGLVFWYAYEDFLAVKNYIRSRQLSLPNVLFSYFKHKVYAIWDFRDPKPFLKFIGSLITRAFRKVFKFV